MADLLTLVLDKYGPGDADQWFDLDHTDYGPEGSHAP